MILEPHHCGGGTRKFPSFALFNVSVKFLAMANSVAIPSSNIEQAFIKVIKKSAEMSIQVSI